MKKKISMKYFFLLMIVQCVFIIGNLKAQIENVIVETYYISDSNDASDTTGGGLESGSKTYRIFIDLKPGTVLRKIYGDANHALKFWSTDKFFNNKADGQSFAKDFSRNRLSENTVALDTWLTLGQITRVSSMTYFGVPKIYDDNGSFIGGTNNDGGSQAISAGLISCTDPAIGIPVTTSDGYDTMTSHPSSWADYGFIDNITGVDSTIFGSGKICNEFISNNAGLQNSGVTGVDPQSNLVLVAQLTTKGELSFELNVEVEENDSSGSRIVKYVTDGSVLLSDERVCPFLKYPQLCGCTDPAYLEYNAAYACENGDSCRTLVVLGCMDTLACNFDPAVNFNIPEICCYPGHCSDRDISVVCPQLSSEKSLIPQLELFPNPSQDRITIQSTVNGTRNVSYIIYDLNGRIVVEKNIGTISSKIKQVVDVAELANGIYLFRIYYDDVTESKIFVKQ